MGNLLNMEVKITKGRLGCDIDYLNAYKVNLFG
jgi:hypothetical protein